MSEHHTIDSYVYLPLESRCIRYLTVCSIDSQLVFSLVAASLDNTPPFVALSYTWDGQERDQELICDGATLRVTKNVHTVLPLLFEYLGPVNLWIDAVCINQDDELEKNVQVPLMHEIYSKTLRTLVWFGESNCDIDEALKSIPTLIPLINVSKGNEEALLALPARNSSIWGGIQNILSKSWFNRVWIFQEAVLPKKVEMMCGANVLPLETMIELVQALQNASLLDWVKNDTLKSRPGVLRLLHIEMYKRWRRVGEHFSFGALVDMGSAWSSYDPRDKIYGILGLAEDSVRAAIAVDYTNKSCQDLSLEVARHEVANEPMLGILHFSCNRPRLPQLPSWCPNFTAGTTSQLIIALATDYHSGNRDMIKRKAVSARTTPVRAKVQDNILEVQGFNISQIDKVVTPGWIKFHHTEVDIAENARKSLEWDDKCFEISQRIFGDDAIAEHARILVGNSMKNARCEFDLQELYQTMRRLMAVVSGKESVLFLHQPGVRQETWSTLPDYMNNVSSACQKRCFFTTRDGFVGLGPSDLETGDTICIFCNSFSPFIIRHTDDGNSQLMGEAYVHGLMYGEIFEQRDEESLETIFLA